MSDPPKKEETAYYSEEEFMKRFDFDPSEVLGEGGFAKVYKAFDKQFDEYVVLKFQTADNVSKYDILNEVKTSRKLSHKNIIRVHEAHVIKTKKASFGSNEIQVGVLEFAEGGNLYDYIKTSPTEEDFKRIFMGVLDGLEFLHNEKQLIHRDLTLDNILIVKEGGKIIPKLADFGISKKVNPDTSNLKKSTQLVGKVEYMAPEQFSADKFGKDKKISTNVDLWSFGIIMYELFLEKTPFKDSSNDNPMGIMHNICNKPLPKDLNQVPEPYREVIKRCLVKNAAYRAQTATELRSVFQNFHSHKDRFNPKVIAIASVVVLLLFSVIYFVNFGNGTDNGESNKIESLIKETGNRKLKKYFEDLTNKEIGYEKRKALIEPIITECFSNENSTVEILVNDIPVEMKGVKDFLENALASDVSEIEIQGAEKDTNKKITNLSVSIKK